TPESKLVDRNSIFGVAPILEGEDPTAYDALLAQISSAVKPADFIEDLWVRDVVNLTWEILRLQRLKISFLSSQIPHHLERALAALMNKQEVTTECRTVEFTMKIPHPTKPNPPPPPAPPSHKLARKWAARDPKAIRRIEKLMASGKLSMDIIYART